jgi:hypothetical protein
MLWQFGRVMLEHTQRQMRRSQSTASPLPDPRLRRLQPTASPPRFPADFPLPALEKQVSLGYVDLGLLGIIACPRGWHAYCRETAGKGVEHMQQFTISQEDPQEREYFDTGMTISGHWIKGRVRGKEGDQSAPVDLGQVVEVMMEVQLSGLASGNLLGRSGNDNELCIQQSVRYKKLEPAMLTPQGAPIPQQEMIYVCDICAVKEDHLVMLMIYETPAAQWSVTAPFLQAIKTHSHFYCNPANQGTDRLEGLFFFDL